MVTPYRFSMVGELAPLAKGDGLPSGWAPTRPFAGWLTVYALIGAGGEIVPVVDRDEQTIDAAAELGRIDWSAYLTNGIWNDTHKPGTVVGVPTGLEFHDGTTARSLADGKIGFWTSGHLLDRNDPESWQAFLPPANWPKPLDLERADYFWDRAQLLAGSPRPLGFSAQGAYAASECGKRVVYAKVTQAAVCELPRNPAATAAPILPINLHVLSKGSALASACDSCSCPAGLRCATRESPPTVSPPAFDLRGALERHGLPPHRAATLAARITRS